MADRVKQYALKATILIPVLIIFLGISLALIIIESIIIINTDQLVEYEKVIDYTDCMDYNHQNCSVESVVSERGWCSCSVFVNLTQPLIGNVSFLYELEEFDQTRSEYKNSRDDKQLMGILTDEPSEACEPYRYSADKRPIAPCGEIADTFFMDTYVIKNLDKNEPVETMASGLFTEEEKKGFKKPANSSLLDKFAFPSGWPKNMQKDKPRLMSFEDERFIGWMKTDLKRKPFGRLENGLEPGKYTVDITYKKSKYNGTRKIIFYNKYNVPSDHTASIVGLAVGCVLLLLTLVVGGLVIRFYPSILNSFKSTSDPKLSVKPSSPELNPLKPNTNGE